MEKTSSQVGFFGKLPGHGDFVRRALPPHLTKLWDSWLQSGLAASRNTLGDDWLDCYLSGPIWRFCLSSGVCGDSRWIGTMMPSVDRVGRYFPLTAITEIPPGRSLFGTAAIAESWFSALEETMLMALDEDSMTAEELESQFAALAPLGTDSTSETLTDQQLVDQGGCCLAVPIAGFPRIDGAVGVLADRLAERFCEAFSLWWSGGSAHVVPSVRVYSNLPPAELFWTLLCSR